MKERGPRRLPVAWSARKRGKGKEKDA